MKSRCFQDRMALTQEAVLSFLLEGGGKVKNSELLNHFRGLLSCGDPAEKQNNRELFKRLVNSVAVVKQIDEVKFVVAKKRYQDFINKEVAHDASEKTQMDESFSSRNTIFSSPSPPPAHPKASARMIYSDFENNNVCYPPMRNDNKCYSDAEPHSVQEEISICGADTTTLKVLNLTTDQRSTARRSGAVFAVIAVKSPPKDSTSTQSKVEQNQTSDKPLTSVSVPSLPNLKFPPCEVSQGWKNRQAVDLQPPGFLQARPPNKTTRPGDDAKMSDCVPLEPVAHEWLVKCAAGRWGQVYGLLLQDIRLAQKKDFISGFTAMHWAAKDGNIKMIHKLMSFSMKGGTFLNINSKAHGGYTPLHIAAIHRHHEVIVMLVQRYRANVNERDHSGKKAFHYLDKGAPAKVRALLGGQQQSKEKNDHHEEYREHPKGLNTFNKLLQPHIVKKQKPQLKSFMTDEEHRKKL